MYLGTTFSEKNLHLLGNIWIGCFLEKLMVTAHPKSSFHVWFWQCCKTRPPRRLLGTRPLAEASWGKSANYSLLGQNRSNSGNSASTRDYSVKKLGITRSNSGNSGLLGQTRSKNNNNTKNEYFYLKYLNFQTIMLVFLNIYIGCYEQLSLYLIIYDLWTCYMYNFQIYT